MLDKTQIAALRKANSVSFYATREGKSGISAVKERHSTPAEPFAQDVRIEIACASRLVNYDRETGIRANDEAYTGFGMIHTSHACEEWQTIASLLREKDVLTLEWQRGAWSSPALTDSGIIGDRLILRVQRGDKRLSFLADHYCGPNNTARMVRMG